MLNTPITKKTKNSRMGKGKGMLLKWTCRIPNGFKLFEFKNYNYKIIFNMTKF
jgi:ribosomal protein L16/L10AE